MGKKTQAVLNLALILIQAVLLYKLVVEWRNLQGQVNELRSLHQSFGQHREHYRAVVN